MFVILLLTFALPILAHDLHLLRAIPTTMQVMVPRAKGNGVLVDVVAEDRVTTAEQGKQFAAVLALYALAKDTV